MSGITHKNLRGTKGVEKTALMEEFKNVRDKEKNNIKKETAKFFAYSDGEWKEAFLAIYPILRKFLRVIEEFDAALTSKKKQLGMLDYTDIERLAFEALVKNGEPTALAKNIAEQYSYVYIDEYQDVNDLQDSIFRAVSRKNNRFAVGDIKQSIYGFRSANPGIFAKAKRGYKRNDEKSRFKKQEPPKRVFYHSVIHIYLRLVRQNVGNVSQSENLCNDNYRITGKYNVATSGDYECAVTEYCSNKNILLEAKLHKRRCAYRGFSRYLEF